MIDTKKFCDILCFKRKLNIKWYVSKGELPR